MRRDRRMNYVNIDIRVTRKEKEEPSYLVAATTAHNQRVAQAAFRLSPEEWQDLEPSLEALNARTLPPLHEHVRKVCGFGQLLFQCLIQGEVQALYEEKKRYAVQNSKVLRLRLMLVPLELIILPWEVLFDPQQSEYLCLTQQPKTVLIRSIDHMRSTHSSRHKSPLRILGMVSEPRELASLNVEKEKRAIIEALELQTENEQVYCTKNRQVYLEWKKGEMKNSIIFH